MTYRTYHNSLKFLNYIKFKNRSGTFLTPCIKKFGKLALQLTKFVCITKESIAHFAAIIYHKNELNLKIYFKNGKFLVNHFNLAHIWLITLVNMIFLAWTFLTDFG